MLTHPKISVWGAYNVEKMPKSPIKTYKNKTKGDRDLKYGSK